MGWQSTAPASIVTAFLSFEEHRASRYKSQCSRTVGMSEVLGTTQPHADCYATQYAASRQNSK
eukprot:scaffold72368_cov61-Attheya_sp.AAC.6